MWARSMGFSVTKPSIKCLLLGKPEDTRLLYGDYILGRVGIEK